MFAQAAGMVDTLRALWEQFKGVEVVAKLPISGELQRCVQAVEDFKKFQSSVAEWQAPFDLVGAKSNFDALLQNMNSSLSEV
eukprot:6223884-Karenia_brevis.AAC.1